MMLGCEQSCAGSRAIARGGGIAARITCCSSRAGTSSASAPSGYGARKDSGCRSGGASASGSGSPRCRLIGYRASALITGGRSTFNGIRPPIDTTSSCCTSSMSSPARRWIECRRRIDADQTVNVLDRLVTERCATPAFIRCDNGPEMTANALRDWCQFSGTVTPASAWVARCAVVCRTADQRSARAQRDRYRHGPRVAADRHGKGDKRREAGMDQFGFERLAAWLTHRVSLPVGPLFCVIDGPTRGRRWAATAARSELRQLAAEAGSVAGSHRISSTTPTRSSSRERALR
jgi:hypothetical protein